MAARVDAKRQANVSATDGEANERVRSESILGEVLGQLTDTDSSVSVRSHALTYDKDPRCPLQTTTTTRSSAPNPDVPFGTRCAAKWHARRPCTQSPASAPGRPAAGLRAHARPVPRYSDEELLRRLAAVAANKLGAAPSRDRWLAQQLTPSVSTIRSLCLLWSEMAQFAPNTERAT
jgi:hypothetical protein